MTSVTCGAQEWTWGDRPDEVILYGTCGLPEGHGIGAGSSWHREIRDGKLWCEWWGDPADRSPIP